MYVRAYVDGIRQISKKEYFIINKTRADRFALRFKRQEVCRMAAITAIAVTVTVAATVLLLFTTKLCAERNKVISNN